MAIVQDVTQVGRQQREVTKTIVLKDSANTDYYVKAIEIDDGENEPYTVWSELFGEFYLLAVNCTVSCDSITATEYSDPATRTGLSQTSTRQKPGSIYSQPDNAHYAISSVTGHCCYFDDLEFNINSSAWRINYSGQPNWKVNTEALSKSIDFISSYGSYSNIPIVRKSFIDNSVNVSDQACLQTDIYTNRYCDQLVASIQYYPKYLNDVWPSKWFEVDISGDWHVFNDIWILTTYNDDSEIERFCGLPVENITGRTKFKFSSLYGGDSVSIEVNLFDISFDSNNPTQVWINARDYVLMYWDEYDLHEWELVMKASSIGPLIFGSFDGLDYEITSHPFYSIADRQETINGTYFRLRRWSDVLYLNGTVTTNEYVADIDTSFHPDISYYRDLYRVFKDYGDSNAGLTFKAKCIRGSVTLVDDVNFRMVFHDASWTYNIALPLTSGESSVHVPFSLLYKNDFMVSLYNASVGSKISDYSVQFEVIPDPLPLISN